MRRYLRTIVIAVLVVTMSFNPASAWNWFRGGRGGYGGYYSGQGGYGDYYGGRGGWGGFGSRHQSGYASYHGGSGCGSYGYSSAGYGCGGYGGYDSCGGGCGGYDSYGYSNCGGSSSGGCDSCGGGGYDSYGGGGCDSCGGYSEYSHGGEVIVDEGTVIDSYEHAPLPPAEMTIPSTMPPPEDRTGTQRPMDTTPVPELPEEPMPGATEPATTPAEEPDDLFGAPPADTTPAVEEPAADDLFGTPSTDTTMPPAEIPTTPPQTEPETPPADVDDLFGTPDASSDGADPAGTDTTPPAGTEEATDAAEDLFGTSNDILHEAGGLASSEMRIWVDNTGKYSCRGRLVRFLDNHVRLLKDNGRTSTVPLARLSVTDLQFVERQASAQQTEMAGQLAQSLSTMPVLAY